MSLDTMGWDIERTGDIDDDGELSTANGIAFASAGPDGLAIIPAHQITRLLISESEDGWLLHVETMDERCFGGKEFETRTAAVITAEAMAADLWP